MALLSDFERIDNILTTLSQTFGPKKDLDQKTIKRLRDIFERCKRDGRFSDFVWEVKTMFSLPMEFRLQYVYSKNLESLPDYARDIAIRNFFNDTDNVAWVTIPNSMPLFGSRDLEKCKLTIKIQKYLRYEKFETFFYCISHEMSHVLLKVVKPELWENEQATDLLTMFMGLSEIVKNGKTSSRSGRAYGYLNEEIFSFAYRRIKEIRRKNDSSLKKTISRIREFFHL